MALALSPYLAKLLSMYNNVQLYLAQQQHLYNTQSTRCKTQIRSFSLNAED